METFERFQGDAQVAGEPVELVDDDHGERAGCRVIEHLRERRPLCESVGAGGIAVVEVGGSERPTLGIAVVAGGAVLGVERIVFDLLFA